MPADTTQVAFTDGQLAWLDRWLERRLEDRWPGVGRSFDRATIMWIIGGLTALGVVAFGVLRAEIGSVRAEVGSLRTEMQQEIRENRAAIIELAKGQARMEAILEAILDERLPRPR